MSAFLVLILFWLINSVAYGIALVIQSANQRLNPRVEC